MNCAERLVDIFGSQAEVARRFRTDRAVVNNWMKSGYVPSRWAMEVERLTDGKIAAVEVLNEANARKPIRLKSRGEEDSLFGPSLAGSDTMNPYVVFLLYLLAILGFVGVTLVMNHVLGPKPVASAMKLEPFECGAIPVDTRNVKAVPIKYYGVAIAFILFDLETVFLFIWALGAQPLTGFMLITFFIFAFLLVLILLYVYKTRLLEAVTE